MLQLWRQDGVYEWGEPPDIEGIRHVPARTHGMRNCRRGVNTCGVSKSRSAQSLDSHLHRVARLVVPSRIRRTKTLVDSGHCVSRTQPDPRLDRRDVCVHSMTSRTVRVPGGIRASMHACKTDCKRRSVRRGIDPKESLREDTDGGMKFRELSYFQELPPKHSHTTEPYSDWPFPAS